MKVVFKEAGREPEIKEIQSGLASMQKLVDGLIEYVPFGANGEFDLWCNEEFLFREDFLPNITDERGVTLHGPIFICTSDDEGKSRGLSDKEIPIVLAFLRRCTFHAKADLPPLPRRY